jgi:putative NADPH-quinone reductase
MPKRITIIQGHPDPRGGHLGHRLADAYVGGAEAAGHIVKVIDVATLDFPVLRTKEDWENVLPADDIQRAQHAIAWAEHVVIFFPLWHGTMPALLKAFLEQVFRPGFAVAKPESGIRWKRLLVGRRARVVITMGMPPLVFRWYFRAHGLKVLERNILAMAGIGPIRATLIGMVDKLTASRAERWFAAMREIGHAAR